MVYITHIKNHLTTINTIIAVSVNFSQMGEGCRSVYMCVKEGRKREKVKKETRYGDLKNVTWMGKEKLI